jgi:pimeloyl-ACP methyl ester carboxylesterase
MIAITPFRAQVADSALADLRSRLNNTRWPDAETVQGWSQGVPLQVMRQLVDYWRTDYDWRRFEAALNAHPQFVTAIDGVEVHFLHITSPYASATPLILTHGWPGSIVEFLKVIGPLTDPVAHGGAQSDAFHLVIPSVPGYGFSSRPVKSGWGIERIADAWSELMHRLGYDKFIAGGGDWGTSISTMIGVRHPESVLGLFLTPPLVAPDFDARDTWTEEEIASVAALGVASAQGGAYSAQHTTRPQTLAYGLADSPAGQAAWIYEKICDWTDSGTDVESVLSLDEILDNITLYWLTGTGASSTRLYWESFATVSEWFNGGTLDEVSVPTAAAVFRDIPRPSRRWVERRFTRLVSWSEPKRGGHFAAWEQPAIFVGEIRAARQALLAASLDGQPPAS